MYISVVVPALFMIIGAVVYLISTRQQVSELGRLLFAAGAFALAFGLATTRFTV